MNHKNRKQPLALLLITLLTLFAVTASAQAPYPLPIADADSAVHEAGYPETDAGGEDALTYSLSYPVLDMPEADGQIRAWLDVTLDSAREISGPGEEATLTTQYTAYRLFDRYDAVLITGFLDSAMLAHPVELVYTLNVDMVSGTLITAADIFREDRIDDVLDMLRESLLTLPDEPLQDVEMDATWLTFALLTPEAVTIVLPRSEYLPSAYGSLAVDLPYAQLVQADVIALDLFDILETNQPQDAEPTP